MGTLEDYFSLAGTAALVTGAARGIGRTVAGTLAGAGAAVACSDLDGDGATSAAKEIEAAGGRAIAVLLDVTDEVSVVDGVAAAAAELGRLDVLVNNAGVYPYMPLESMPVEFFEQVYRVNVVGTMLCMREAVKAIRASGGGGAIINLASMTGLQAQGPMLGAYGSSKAAVLGLTRNAALEFAPDDIRVNAVAPGFVHTEGTSPLVESGMAEMVTQRQPLKRIATPEDLAGMVLALASRAGSFVTGTTIVVDGGFTQA